jgi:hypothetical protein
MTDRKPCSFPGCTHPLDAGGLCRGHRGQRDRGVELTPLREVGVGYASISLRLRPETISALHAMTAPGQSATVTAREILQAATGTAPAI